MIMALTEPVGRADKRKISTVMLSTAGLSYLKRCWECTVGFAGSVSAKTSVLGLLFCGNLCRLCTKANFLMLFVLYYTSIEYLQMDKVSSFYQVEKLYLTSCYHRTHCWAFCAF